MSDEQPVLSSEVRTVLQDAAAMLRVFTDPRGSVNPSTRGQARSVLKDIQKLLDDTGENNE